MKKILLLLISIILLSSFASATLNESNSNIEFYYNATAAGTVAFNAAGTGDGDILGGNARSSQGKIGNGFLFDDGNDDGVDTNKDSNIIGGGRDWSFIVWFNSSDTGNTQDLIVNYDGGFDSDSMMLYTNGAKMHIRYGSNPSNIDTALDVITGKFVHFAVVHYNADNRLVFYVNGTLDSNYSTSGYGSGASADPMIGNRPGLDTAEWIGVIDEVGIWNVTLSAADILESYNLTFGLTYPFTNITPPDFFIDNSTFNMTSDGGNISWRTNKSAPVPTTDGTPTITFDTNKNADCSIRTTEHDYNASFICGTTGGLSHVCTVYYADRLSFGLNNIVASCEASAETDTTGNMIINMTAGEGGTGLVDCISTIGTGCGVTISNDCAVIT